MASFSIEETSKLSVEALADIQVPQDFHISPDGKQIVYSLKPWTRKGESFTSALWIADLATEKSTRQLTSGLFRDKGPQWSPDGQYIAFISDRAKAGKSSAIYLISTAGGEAFPITPPENKEEISKFEWCPNSQFIGYLSPDEATVESERKKQDKDDAKVWGQDWSYQRLRYVHVSTKQITTVVTGEKHVHLFSWGPDFPDIAYVLHQTPDINSAGFYGSAIERANIATKATTRLTTFPGPLTQFVYAKDGIFFLGGAIPQHCSTARSLYKIASDETGYEKHGFGDVDCCLGLQKCSSFTAVRVQSGLYDEIHRIQASQKGSSRQLYRGMHDITAFDVSIRDGCSEPVVAITKSDGQQPTEIFSFVSSSAGSRTIQLSDHNSAIAKLKISKARPIYTSAADGYPLDGIVFLPSDAKSGKALPTVVLAHGGPYWRITVGFAVCHYYEVPLLTSTGYAVLCPNYRGGSSRGQEHAAYARGAMGTVDYDDTITVLKAGIAEGIVDGSRVAIGGWSQGGFLSYLAVTRTDFKFKGAVCGAGVVDWDMLTMTSDAYWFEADLSGGAAWDVDPDATDEFSPDSRPEAGSKHSLIRQTNGRHGSAIWNMKNVNTPVLILHGEDDVRVPVSQAIAFWRACIHRGVPVEMITYPREGHLFEERKHMIDLWSRMRKFYDMHLGS